MKKQKLLVMDNDGCLVDSVMEALVSSFNGFIEIKPKTKLFDGRTFTAKEFLGVVKTGKYSKIVREFRMMRPFIRSAQEYAIIFEAIEQSKRAKTQEEFDFFRKQTSLDFIEYEKAVYKAREELQKDYNSWYQLTPGYKGVVSGIKKLLKEGYIVAVATTNSRNAIKRMFQEKYLGFPIDEENIADKTIGVDEKTRKIGKAKQLAYLASKNNLVFSNMIFVDDQVSHLEAVKNSTLKTSYGGVCDVCCILAGYGFTTKGQKDKAISLGIPVIPGDMDFYNIIKQNTI